MTTVVITPVSGSLPPETQPETTQPETTQLPTPLDFETLYRAGYPVTLARARGLLARGNRGRAFGLQTEFAGDGWLPEDVAQEVWARLWKHWAHLQHLSIAQVMAFARQATDHLWIDRMRHRRLAAERGRMRLDADGWEAVTRALAASADPVEVVDDGSDGVLGDQPESALLWRETLAELRAVVMHDRRDVVPAMPAMPAMPAGRQAPLSSSSNAGRQTLLTPPLTPQQRKAIALFEALLCEESPTVTAARLHMSMGSVKTHQWRTRQLLRTYLRESLNESLNDVHDGRSDCVAGAADNGNDDNDNDDNDNEEAGEG